MKMSKLLISVLVLSLWAAGAAWAATATAPLTLTYAPAAFAKLTLSPTTISFPDMDPDTNPTVSASSPVTVTASVRTGTAANPTLTVVCTDLKSGATDTITADNVTWTSPGTNGYNASGTMNKTTAQAVGSWTGSGSRIGTLTYKLLNSWNWPIGSYTATATYTLTAP
jgi:hypothetical protein